MVRLAVLSAIALGGCSLALSLDGLSGGPPSPSSGGDTEAGASSGTGPSTSGDGGGSTSSSGQVVTPLPEGATPLTRSGSPKDPSITFTVEGRVSLGFVAKTGWQLGEWRDLAAGGAVALGHSTIGISEPIQVGYDGDQFGVNRAEDGTVEIIEETAARATLRTTFRHRAPNGSEHLATTTYVIYADGRVVESTEYHLTSGALPAVDYFEFAHTNVTTKLPWSIAILSGGAAFEFVQQGGTAALVVATHEASRSISNDDPKTNRFWTHHGPPEYSGEFAASWEYRFYDGAPADDRAAWVAAVGAAIAHPSYDKTSGAFRIDAKGGATSTFELPPGVAWDGPAFVIDDFGAPTLRATLGGAEAKVIAAKSGTGIVVLLVGQVAADASATDRTLVFSAGP